MTSWRSPWAPSSIRGSFQTVVSVWVDVSGGGGEGLDQEVAVMEGHMVTIPPHMFFPDERLRKLGAERESVVTGCGVVRVDIGGRGGEERRRFDEDDT